MMPAAKHGDTQMGIDTHFCVVPLSPSPVPLPTPHISVVYDPIDYIPGMGTSVTVGGMKAATAGTAGMVVHIPPGVPFAPMLPVPIDLLFMGSSTVAADGNPLSSMSHPVIGCQAVGTAIPIRPTRPPSTPMLVAPTESNLAMSSGVYIGGSPSIF